MNIFIGKLNSLATEKQLENLFVAFGEVRSVKIIVNIYTGKSKGFGFVDMPDRQSAVRAIKELNRSILNEQIIGVSEARIIDNNQL